MIRYFFLTIAAVFFGTAAYLFFYLGAHKSVFLERQTYPEMQVIYKNHLGPYHEINSQLEAVEDQVQKFGVRCPKTFGEFLDDPKTVDADRLRSKVGCVVEEIDDELVAMLPSELFVEIRPPADVLYAKFTGSPAIGPFKVYPKAQALAQENRWLLKTNTVEIYTLQRNGQLTTEYLFFLENSAPNP